jgi:8-oxo-dGTP pyrophosphatase MutT (NUDIX family)
MTGVMYAAFSFSSKVLSTPMNETTNLSNLPELLRRRLAKSGNEKKICNAHREWAPRYAYGRHRGPAPRYSHPAAVLICLLPVSHNEWSIPLTLRPTQMADHGGQVSLPGGRSESGETVWRTACREFGEELGCTTEYLQPICELSPLYVYASRHLVTPIVAVSSFRPSFNPNQDEVAELIFLPLRELIADEAMIAGTMKRGTIEFDAPGLRIGTHFVWGATAMILGQLRSMVREILLEQVDEPWFM